MYSIQIFVRGGRKLTKTENDREQKQFVSSLSLAANECGMMANVRWIISLTIQYNVHHLVWHLGSTQTLASQLDRSTPLVSTPQLLTPCVKLQDLGLGLAWSLGLIIIHGRCVQGHLVRESFWGLDKLAGAQRDHFDKYAHGCTWF